MVATGCAVLLSGCSLLLSLNGVRPTSGEGLGERIWALFSTNKGIKMPPQVYTMVQWPDGTVVLDLTVDTPPVAAATPAPSATVAAPPEAAAATPVPAAPAVAQAAAPVTAKAAPAAPADDQQTIRHTLDSWRKAWASGNAAGYFDQYESKFKGQAHTRAAWEKQRREKLANGNIDVALEDLKVKTAEDKAEVTFTQRYRSNRHTDTGAKQMQLWRVAGKWLIVTEKWSGTPARPSGSR